MKMEAVCTYETFVYFFKSTRRCNLEGQYWTCFFGMFEPLSPQLSSQKLGRFWFSLVLAVVCQNLDTNLILVYVLLYMKLKWIYFF
jgi:hypothetical protein